MHKPHTINKFKTGLVQYQPNQILVDDAFPVLQNAVVYRNTVRRRESWTLLGQASRTLTTQSIGMTGASPWTFNVYNLLGITGEPNAQIAIGSVVITIAAGPDIVFTDQGNGTLTSPIAGNSGTIIYSPSGNTITLTHTAGAGIATTISFSYYPALPAMAIFDRVTAGLEKQNVYFDTKYAYRYFDNVGFLELLPGTTWSMDDWRLPSCMNYWQDDNNLPLFWVTSNTGTLGNPIRYTNAVTATNWIDFTPTISAGVKLFQCKFLIPFRGRVFAFNTLEGGTLAGSTLYSNRIRCCAIGNPITDVSAIVTTVNALAWDDSIPGAGNGYFEDLPTSEQIIGVWLVKNQIIIKSNTQTYVLSNLGSNIAPFKVDLLDENLGTLSGFGSVNMGGYIEGIGQRAITSTSTTEVVAIDKKILDFVFNINAGNQGYERVYGVRNFRTRINSYIYPYEPDGATTVTYPNFRLVHNYDNDSWGIYEDSLTCLGYFRGKTALTWAEANFSWESASDMTWSGDSTNYPVTTAGNQQGYFGKIDNGVEEGTSISITSITPLSGSAATFSCPNHNLSLNTVIELTGFIGDYASLNGVVGQITAIDVNSFWLFSYDSIRDLFSIPVQAPSGTYIGGGRIIVRRNFSIVTKAFNMLEQGQSMHISYLDAIVNVQPGSSVEISVYMSNNNSNAVNLIPENNTSFSIFGNQISLSNPTTYNLNEVNNRALINQRGNMITLEFDLSNATMASTTYNTTFVLSGMTIWEREAGRPLMPFGGG